MDAIAKLQSVKIPDIYGPTYQAFLTLLEGKRSEIESIKKSTFQYGATERHKLDVYYPQDLGSRPPILLFSYGGALQVGDRILPESKGLIYANLGAYFARKGILTVIADYRLVPAGAIYPDASRDVGDALAWIVKNLEKEGDTHRVFIYGHSAGALNQSLLLTHPNLLHKEVRPRIKGAIFNGGAFRIEGKNIPEHVQAYFGRDGLHITNSPWGLLRAASDSLVASFPPIFILMAEREPPLITTLSQDFIKLLKTRNVEVAEYTIQGHNHISSNLALSSGEGEDWAEEVVSWIRSQT